MERIQEMLKGCPDFKLEELNYGNPDLLEHLKIRLIFMMN